MKERICPLRVIASTIAGYGMANIPTEKTICLREKCAWWDIARGECTIKTCGDMLRFAFRETKDGPFLVSIAGR